jgi:hypothetical protein
VALQTPPVNLLLRLAPGVSRGYRGLAGPSGRTQVSDPPLLDALDEGATLEHLLAVGTPRAVRDVHGVLDVLHRRQLLAWQIADDEGIAGATLVPLRREVALPVPGGWTAEPTTPL